jgi:hypothetical protein
MYVDDNGNDHNTLCMHERVLTLQSDLCVLCEIQLIRSANALRKSMRYSAMLQ